MTIGKCLSEITLRHIRLNHGRPSKSTQTQMHEKLKKYFEYGITATTAAQEIGLNIKTVCKYFEEWSEAALEQQNQDYIERQKIERERTIISFDRQIIEAIELLEGVKSEIKKHQEKQIPRHLMMHRLEIQKFIATLVDKRGSFAMHLTVDDAVRKKIAELIRKDENRKDNQ